MSYQKQVFQSGQVLLASQLNAMDDQIAANAEAISANAEAIAANAEAKSSAFSLDNVTMPDGTNAFKMTLSSTSNQIGLQKITINYTK